MCLVRMSEVRNDCLVFSTDSDSSSISDLCLCSAGGNHKNFLCWLCWRSSTADGFRSICFAEEWRATVEGVFINPVLSIRDGRTPWIDQPYGRGHHNFVYSSWMAGSCVKPGISYGQSE